MILVGPFWSAVTSVGGEAPGTNTLLWNFLFAVVVTVCHKTACHAAMPFVICDLLQEEFSVNLINPVNL